MAVDLKSVADDLKSLIPFGQWKDRGKRTGIDTETPPALQADRMVVVCLPLILEASDTFPLQVYLVHQPGVRQHSQVAIDRIQTDTGIGLLDAFQDGLRGYRRPRVDENT